MSDTARNMNITVRKGDSGMFFATSEDEPTFFLAQPTRADLLALLPFALETTIRSLYSRDVTALPPEDGAEGGVQVCIVSREQLHDFAPACS